MPLLDKTHRSRTCGLTRLPPFGALSDIPFLLRLWAFGQVLLGPECVAQGTSNHQEQPLKACSALVWALWEHFSLPAALGRRLLVKEGRKNKIRGSKHPRALPVVMLPS